jgi:hypothetical protein
VSDFLRRSLDYLESAGDPELGYPADGYRLVQRWLWFALYTTGAGSVSNLLTIDPLGLTQHGDLFRSHVIGRGASVNLAPAPIAPVTLPYTGAPASAAVTVQVANRGTKANPAPFTVAFYGDAELTKPIGTVGVPGGLAGCAMRTATVSVTLTGLGPGTTRYWVQADSGGAVAESDEGDNVTSGVVIVMANARRTLLPFVTR